MWNLLAALGLGAVHTAVNIRDSWRHADAQTRINLQRNTLLKVTPEHGWEDKVIIEGCEEHIYARLHNDLVVVFGQNYREVFDLYDRSEIFYDMGTRYWARMLIMSHEGKFAVEKTCMDGMFSAPARKNDPYWYDKRPVLMRQVMNNIRKTVPSACLVSKYNNNSWEDNLRQGYGWTGEIYNSYATDKPIFP